MCLPPWQFFLTLGCNPVLSFQVRNQHAEKQHKQDDFNWQHNRIFYDAFGEVLQITFRVQHITPQGTQTDIDKQVDQQPAECQTPNRNLGTV